MAVIIPLYNKAPYIRRALESVLAQTLADVEVLVIDDGSTDDGPEAVARCPDPRVRLIRQPNAGPGAARNRGVRETAADYVAFLDADDEWCPTYLETAYTILRQHPDCEVCVTARRITMPDGTVHSSKALLEQRTGRTYCGPWQLTEPISDSELENTVRLFLADGVLLSRALFHQTGGFSEISSFGEDWCLWITLLMSRRIYFNDAELVIVHDEAPGITGQGLRRNPLQAYFCQADRLRENCPAENRSLLERFLALHALRQAHLRAGVGNVDAARYLVTHFPAIKRVNYLSYGLLRAKLAFPRLHQQFRRRNKGAISPQGGAPQ